MSENLVYLLAWLGLYSPLAFGAIGSIIGCTTGGQAACGAMLDVESGYGKYIGISIMPSSQTIYGIVIMFLLQGAATVEGAQTPTFGPENAFGIFAIGVLSGMALMASAIYQGRCCASAINASKNKPSIFGMSVAPAAVVEGFSVFAFVFALVLTFALPEVTG